MIIRWTRGTKAYTRYYIMPVFNALAAGTSGGSGGGGVSSLGHVIHIGHGSGLFPQRRVGV